MFVWSGQLKQIKADYNPKVPIKKNDVDNFCDLNFISFGIVINVQVFDTKMNSK